MKTGLLPQALLKFFGGLILMGLVLFLPAGTFDYWNAWLLMGILFVPMLITGSVLFFKAPELLKKRLNANEGERQQKRVILLSSLMFLGGFVISGLDFRFGWSKLPLWAVMAAAAVFLMAYAIWAEVLRENAFLSRTVEVQENQTVVDTGLYGVVRHPMYFATVLLFLAMPLVLGSIFGFIVFLLYPFIIASRIRNEEQVLLQGLPGYEDYTKKVKYRLIPFIW